MKLNGPLITRIVSRPVSMLIRMWMTTLSCRALFDDPKVNLSLSADRPRIYLFWHENILFPLHYCSDKHVAILLSQHRDADILARIGNWFRFYCVRGSSYRGGVRALRELAKVTKTHHIAISPDGPRGPRRTLAAGPIFLASKMQMPIVLGGIAYDRPWRLKSWDRFAVPRPFSRTRAIASGEIMVPPDLDRDGIEHWRQKIENELNRRTEEAQQWAESGEKRAGEVKVNRHTRTNPPGPAPKRRKAAKPLSDAA